MSKYREVTRAIETKVHAGDIPKGTLNQIRKQLRLDRTQFEEFVRCTMFLADYETHLRLLVQADEL